MHLSSYLVVRGKVTNTNYILFEWERQFIFFIFFFLFCFLFSNRLNPHKGESSFKESISFLKLMLQLLLNVVQLHILIFLQVSIIG